MPLLTLLPPSSTYSTQRCVVGPAVFEDLNIPVGSWCAIQRDGYQTICSAWLRHDLHDGFIEIQDTVTVGTSETGRETGRSISTEDIRPISSPSPCDELAVSVFTDFKHLQGLQEVSRVALTRQLRHLLIGYVLLRGCHVSMQSGFVFGGPKISHVIVNGCTKWRETTSHPGGEVQCPSMAISRVKKLSLQEDIDSKSGYSDAISDSPPKWRTYGNNDSSSDIEGNKDAMGSTSSRDESKIWPNNRTSTEETPILCPSEQSPNLDTSEDVEPLLITERTRIIIKLISAVDASMQDHRSEVRVGGLDKAAALLKKLVEYPATYPATLEKLGLMQSHGVLLKGPPGCGKTTLMRSVAAECKVCLIQVNGVEIFGSSPVASETNLRRVFAKAKAVSEAQRCILFLDELDALCPRRDRDNGGTQEGRVVAELLMLMDEVRGRSNILVVGATSRPNALDPALRRPGRFDEEVLVGMPSTSQRVSILETHCFYLHLADSVCLAEVAELCNGFSGADLACLCRLAVFRALGRTGDQEGEGTPAQKKDQPTVTMDDFISCLSHVTPSLHRTAGSIVKELRPVTWESIGGLADVKAQLKQAVEWPMLHWRSFARLGVSGPLGVLLHGPPGCCKTTLAQAAATASRASFLSVSCAELYSPCVGDSEKIITEVFRKARLTAPAIVFLDELDSLIGGRGKEAGRGLSERLLSCLLVEMDGVGVAEDGQIPVDEHIKAEFRRPQVMVIAASNRIDLIDAALLRPGRFDCLIHVPPPDRASREDILLVCTRHMPVAEDVDLKEIAAATVMYTGADLQGLCKEAGLMALQESGLENADSCRIHHSHFVAALDLCRPSLEDDLSRQEETAGVNS